MKGQQSGKIITVASVAGTAASRDGGYAHYGAAKAAIAHYTRYLAQDLGPFGITANCIAPGVIPVETQTSTTRTMEGFLRHAEKATGVKWELYQATDYSAQSWRGASISQPKPRASSIAAATSAA